MNIFHVRKSGNDANSGLTKDDSVLTIAAALALCSATEWNMLIFGPGNWAENFGVVNKPIYVIGCNFPTTILIASNMTHFSGAADANPLIDAQAPFSIAGAMVYSSQAGKQHIILNSIENMEVSNCLMQIGAINQRGIVLAKGLAKIHDNIFVPTVVGVGSYYLEHTGEAFPANIYSNIFVWDSVLGFMTEPRITLDSIVGGSKAKYNNNVYADVDMVTLSLRSLSLTRDTYPTGATCHDPEPGQAVVWNEINLQIKLATRNVEDGSIVTDKTETEAAITAAEVLLEGAGSRDNTEIYNKIISLAGGPVVVIDVPEKLIRPVAGSTVYRIAMNIYDSEGNPEAPDADPTIKITNRDETVVRVAEIIMSGVAVGQYYYDYTIDSATTLEKESIIIKMIEGGITTYHREVTEIYDEGSSGSGSGSVIIDHDYGGIDNYQILRIGTGAPIEGANLYMFTQADWNAGNRDLRSVHDGGNCRGQSTTGSDGRWLTPIALDPDTYIMFVSDPLGEYIDSPITIIVT